MDDPVCESGKASLTIEADGLCFVECRKCGMRSARCKTAIPALRSLEARSSKCAIRQQIDAKEPPHAR